MVMCRGRHVHEISSWSEHQGRRGRPLYIQHEIVVRICQNEIPAWLHIISMSRKRCGRCLPDVWSLARRRWSPSVSVLRRSGVHGGFRVARRPFPSPLWWALILQVLSRSFSSRMRTAVRHCKHTRVCAPFSTRTGAVGPKMCLLRISSACKRNRKVKSRVVGCERRPRRRS